MNIIKRIWRLYCDKSGSDAKIRYLRKQGMKIGKDCHLETFSFSTEPYLVEIGDDVTIASGTVFITHDGAIIRFKADFPDEDIFGKITVGNNVFIGDNCMLLPNTRIGNNCIIGAGSVLRGKFPDNTVIIGNPAKVIANMNVQKLIYSQSKGRLKTRSMTDAEKKPIVIEHFNHAK
jgi:acetyltransferase-like isoleucine patch superfamily enzyme